MRIVMIPEVCSDRYARLNYGYDGELCYLLKYDHKPKECRLGGDDAQRFAAWSHAGKYTLLFFLSPVVGSMSDLKGRRRFYLFSIFLHIMPHVALVMMLLVKSVNPMWYFVAHFCTGFADWLPLTFAAISDIMPGNLRTSSYALVLVKLYLALAGAPYLVTTLSHLLMSIIALGIAIFSFFYAWFSMKETLSFETSITSEINRRQENRDQTWTNSFLGPISSLLRHLSILNRTKIIRLLSIVSFVTALTYATDQTFIVYYLEDRLSFEDSDTFVFLLISSICAIIVNMILLEHFIKYCGEKYVLMVAIVFGTFHNFLYGTAKRKVLVFVAAGLSSLTGMSYPINASMLSSNCANHEQGHIQGAFFSMISLANALGPSFMAYVYHFTEDSGYFGSGTMFVVVSLVNVCGLFVAFSIPKNASKNDAEAIEATSLQQPLLDDNESVAESAASTNSIVELF